MTVFIQKWTPFRMACAMRSLQQGVNAGANRQIARLALLAKAITAALTAPYALTTLATATGTTGQFSFGAAAHTLVVGQQVTITGTNAGTGTITGYATGNQYLVSATNGTTTATLTTLAGAALATVAGSLTGLTGTVSSWAKWRVGENSLVSSNALLINVPAVPGFVSPVGTVDDGT
jgi:plastocyanin